MKEELVQVNAKDFESLGEKLQKLHASLSPNEANIFEYLMEAAGHGAGQFPGPSWLPRPHFKYHPRGGSALVIGGTDGLTVLVSGRGHIRVIPPTGPLPQLSERTGFVGALAIHGAETVGRG